ncbi:MAG: glycosyltransferase family 4 protein [Saprospiraceae bacterium]|nr:glycosyltransferase family 4 protein [Saprospiraceae bacterium]
MSYFIRLENVLYRFKVIDESYFMKILMYNDWKTILGGTERYIHNLIPFLSQHHEVHFISAEDILPIKDLSHYQRKLTIWKKNEILVHYLKTEIETFKPDIIHIHNVYYYFHSVLFTFRSSNVPVALTLHDSQYLNLPNDKTWQYFIKRLKRRQLKNVVRTFFAPSQLIFKMASIQFLKDIHYLPHFIDARLWPCQNHLDNSLLKLLYVGNIDRKKGVFFLLKVLQQLLENNFDVNITFLGKGKDELALTKEINSKKLQDRVNMPGHQNDSSIQQFFSNHFALVLPSLCVESFGLVGLEAQASGLPVIVSNLGGVSEWAIEKETAILAHPNDIDDWCDKIKLLWMNKQLYYHIRDEAMKRVHRNFQPQTHCDNLISYYNQMY